MIRRLAALAAATLLPALAGCALTPPPGGSAGTTPGEPPGTVRCDFRVAGTPARAVDPPAGQAVRATGTSRVTLDFGDFAVAVDLDHEAAPCAVHSFLSLADQGFYTGTTCHRLSTQRLFMLQCGDPTGTGSGGPGYTFDDEVTAGAEYPAGTVAMANAGPDTNGSQFFLVFADSALPPRYTVFGRMDAAGTQAVADLAFLGHDSSWPDGTGRPNAPAGIRAVVNG